MAQHQEQVVQDLPGWTALPTPAAVGVVAINLVPWCMLLPVLVVQEVVVLAQGAMYKLAPQARQIQEVVVVADQVVPAWVVWEAQAFLCCVMQTHWPTYHQ
jgi:hypothetical protein